jgi:hypothetical protein
MRYTEILVERGLNANDLVKHGDDRLNLLLQKISNGDDFVRKGNAGTVKIAKNEKGKIENAIRSGNTRTLKFLSTEGETLSLSKLEKTGEFGSTGEDESGERKMANRGNTMEGVLGAATIARLSARPGKDITADDIKTVVNNFSSKKAPDLTTKSGGGSIVFPAVANDITDNFKLTVKLPTKNYIDFVDWQFMVDDAEMNGYINSCLKYVNDATIVDRFAKFFENNNRPDTVHVVADGVSDMTGRKTDIFMVYIDENGKEKEQRFDLSLKAGTTPQFGQAAAGGTKDSSKKSAKGEYGWNAYKQIFADFGVDVSAIGNKYLGAESLRDAVVAVYTKAGNEFHTQLAGSDDDAEKVWLKQFVNNIKEHGTYNNPKVQLAQFEKNKYYVLDFQRLDRLLDKDILDLDVKMTVSKPRDGGPGWPSLIFYNKQNEKEVLVRIRSKYGADKMNNLIEKGSLLKKLTKVRGN